MRDKYVYKTNKEWEKDHMFYENLLERVKKHGVDDSIYSILYWAKFLAQCNVIYVDQPLTADAIQSSYSINLTEALQELGCKIYYSSWGEIAFKTPRGFRYIIGSIVNSPSYCKVRRTDDPSYIE